jgi:hypothetical protein
MTLAISFSSCVFVLPEERFMPTTPEVTTVLNENNQQEEPITDSEVESPSPRAVQHELEEDDGDCTTPIKCLNCETVVVRAQTHNFTGEWIGDETGHYRPCIHEGCTAHKPTENHLGGIATCVEGRLCKLCGYEYTDINPNNHVEFDSVTGECACGKLAEAKVGDIAYETFEEAFRNWQDGTTLTLLKDIDYDYFIYVSNKTVTLDLNGKILRHIGDPIESFISVLSNGDLTILDNIGTGQIISEEYTVDVYGKLLILGGEIKGQVGIEAHIRSTVEISVNARIMGVNNNPELACYSIEALEGANLTISGSAIIVGTISTRNAITFNSQPTDGEVWNIYMANTGVFAIAGDGVVLDESKFSSSVDGYTVIKQEDGSLSLIKN